MIPGLTGSLLSHDALERIVPGVMHGLLDEAGQAAARRAIRAWHVTIRSEVGPAAGPRTVFDRIAAPLFANLGFEVLPYAPIAAAQPGDRSGLVHAVLHRAGSPVAALVATAWGRDPSGAWRDAVRLGLACGVRWCFAATGPALRIVDARRTYSRRFVQFDLEPALDDERAFASFWGLLRADAMSGQGSPLLERAVEISEQHRAGVRDSLQEGVHEALGHLVHAFAAARPRKTVTLDEPLIVVYRILFLLFAEARGLVPRWHPVYRDAYTIESLRGAVEMLPRPRGLWETLQAIARLAHRGCRAGTLRVPPFNGRLFSPADAPLADTLPLDDAGVRRALLALTTRPGAGGRERIAYGDLGVEQLGGVYERLLDLAVESPAQSPALVRTDRRKATGSFYTPRSLTEYLVRRTLGPLVRDATQEAILSLRVLDPAMGSGAFLVAACRYLASAYESALLRDGDASSDDLSEQDRAGFRRTVAARCLYGVDINPMAVQLGRLSLWLATLAADRPLGFLDHRLRCGDSLVGASLDDLRRTPDTKGDARRRRAWLPLFEDADSMVESAMRRAVDVRVMVATRPDETVADVRGKERALADLVGDESGPARWKRVADLWCSTWFGGPDVIRSAPKAFPAVADVAFGRAGTLAGGAAEAALGRAEAVARTRRFFHWAFEFPEIFYDAAGTALSRPGFDAIVGNPPWEMVRADRGSDQARSRARSAASCLLDFVRAAGVYACHGDAHVNLYQLFLERALSLLRHGGRLGFVLPAGFAIDHGAAALRRAVLDRTQVDGWTLLENRDGVFPIHRGLKFLLLTTTSGMATKSVPCRAGVRRPEALDEVPDTGVDSASLPVNRALLERIGGSHLVVPELRAAEDIAIVADLVYRIPTLEDRDGWHVRFGRELNATEDRRHFVASGEGLRVIEGKQVGPFSVDLGASRFRLPARVAPRLLDPSSTYERSRLAYRDVASATNRLTLIAAVLPRGVVTTHTLFCLKDPLDLPAQHFLCAMLNSFVANYLVRMRVSNHVTVAIVGRLPVPKPARGSPEFRLVAALGRRLARAPSDVRAAARLQATAARVYGLGRDQFAHVLDTFPLVPRPLRDDAMRVFCDIVS